MHGPVLRGLDHGHQLRHSRSRQRPALQPRPARRRQEGRGLSEVDRHRRHRASSARRPSSSCSTTSASRPTPTTRASSSIRSNFPTNSDTPYDGRQSRPPHPHQGRLFPGSAAGFGAGHARRDAGGDGADGRRGREAPPRGRLGAARTRLEVRPADADGRQHADLQILHPHGRAELRQDRDLHAEAGLRRQRLGHARPSVDLEGRQAGDGGQQIRRPQPGMPVVHRRHHQARQGAQRLHQPHDQQLQAAGPGLRGAGAARLFRAQPLGLVPHSVDVQPEGQARRGSFPRPDGQSLSGLRGDADGRPRRHPEQDRSGRRRWTRTSTTCRPRS